MRSSLSSALHQLASVTVSMEEYARQLRPNDLSYSLPQTSHLAILTTRSSH